MERLEEAGRVEILSGYKKTIDVPGDGIVERIHSIFVVESKFFFVCL